MRVVFNNLTCTRLLSAKVALLQVVVIVCQRFMCRAARRCKSIQFSAVKAWAVQQRASEESKKYFQTRDAVQLYLTAAARCPLSHFFPLFLDYSCFFLLRFLKAMLSLS